MKWNLSLPDFPELLYYFVKLTGLAPFTVKDNVFYAPNVFSQLYPLLVATSYLLFVLVSYASMLENFMREHHSLFFTAWITASHFLSLPSTLLTPVIFLVMHKKIIHALNTLRTVSIELQSLGIEENHGKLFKKLFATTATANASLAAALVILNLLQRSWPILFSIKYCFDSWFDLNTILIFTQMLIWIRENFTLINEKLYDISKPTRRLGLPDHSRFSIMDMDTEEANRLRSEDLTDLQRILKIQDVHFKLCDLVYQTTYLFNVPIILTSIRYFITLMTYCYRLISHLRIADHPCEDTVMVSFDIASILCSVIWMSIAISSLIIITHASATACEQGNTTRVVLFSVWIKLSPGRLLNAASIFDINDHQLEFSGILKYRFTAIVCIDCYIIVANIMILSMLTISCSSEKFSPRRPSFRTFFKFYHQLLHKPVAVSVFGSVELDYSLIFKIFCIVTTYLIVIVQIEPLLPC